MQPLDILGRNEPMVDDFLFDSIRGLEFKVNRPQRRETAFTPRMPWDSGLGSGVYDTVFKDGDEYRLYYRGVIAQDRQKKDDYSDHQCCCLAVSRDGIHWEYPELDVFEYGGRKTNAVFFGSHYAHNFTPFIDENPDCRPGERYKAVAGLSGSGLNAYSSPDGIHWALCAEGVITDGAFDSQNVAFYDRHRGQYICYSRFFKETVGEDGKKTGVRAIQSCVSDDFLNWSPQRENVYNPENPLEHYYTNAVTPVPGAEHLFVSFPMRFVPGRAKENYINMEGYLTKGETGVSDSVLLTSRDGVHWNRSDPGAYIVPHHSPDCWTQRCNMIARGIIETGDEFSVYMDEGYCWGSNRIMRYSFPKFRFMSLSGGFRGGLAVTKPLLFGERVCLNYASSAAGSIKITLTGPGGEVAASDELYGNALDEEAVFKDRAALASLRGKPVALRLEIRDAELFSLRLE